MRTSGRVEKTAMPAKGDRGRSESDIARSYSECQRTTPRWARVHRHMSCRTAGYTRNQPIRGNRLMPDTPTFVLYTEIPYDQMTREQQEGYRSLIETRGQVGGPSKIWVHNPKLAKAAGPLGAHFHPGGDSLSVREREIVVCILHSKGDSAYP